MRSEPPGTHVLDPIKLFPEYEDLQALLQAQVCTTAEELSHTNSRDICHTSTPYVAFHLFLPANIAVELLSTVLLHYCTTDLALISDLVCTST